MSVEEQVVERVRQFVIDNNITSPESIYQTDRVIENAYTFIEDLCDIVGYAVSENE